MVLISPVPDYPMPHFCREDKNTKNFRVFYNEDKNGEKKDVIMDFFNYDKNEVSDEYLLKTLDDFPDLTKLQINLNGLEAKTALKYMDFFFENLDLHSLYMGFGKSPWSRVSEKISNLKNLELFSIDVCNGHIVLPPNMKDLKNLKTFGLKTGLSDSLFLPASFFTLESLECLALGMSQFFCYPKTAYFLQDPKTGQGSVFYDSKTGDKINFDTIKFWRSISDLSGLKGLKTLYLPFLPLLDFATFPESICALKNLEYLDLSRNALRGLPDSFGNLSKLKFLDLSETYYLSSLPESIGELHELETLLLDQNMLTCLPDSFGNLTNLKKLSLSMNKLKSLPDSFGNLSNLLSLYTIHCGCDVSIEMIKNNFKNLTELYINYSHENPKKIGKLKLMPNHFFSREGYFDCDEYKI